MVGADNRQTFPRRTTWQARLGARPYVSLGLAVALLVIVLLLAATARRVAVGTSDAALVLGLAGGAAAFAATAVGAVPALFLRRLSNGVGDTMLGMAAGTMLAASAFSLILPGLEAGEALTGSRVMAGLVVVAGLLLGGLLMLGLDNLVPRESAHPDPQGLGVERVTRIWLFVFAIALHNFPEGMAIGVSLSQGDLSVGLPFTSAIAIQDIPEGLAVAIALKAIGLPSVRAVAVAAATGLIEPVGALLGVGLTNGLDLAYPTGLGLAAGAMIFVVSHEVIPETHRNGHQTMASVGLLAGFALMMMLDTTLG